MEKGKEIFVLIKFAEIDDTPFPNEQEGWVSSFVTKLTQTLSLYFRNGVRIKLKNESDAITEDEFYSADALMYVLSPAFMLSSNLAADLALIEKVSSFNINLINAKIYKVLKGPINIKELPATISMGSFHHFYQMSDAGDSGYETLFEWDKSSTVRAHYWESLSNLIFDVLKNVNHEKKERFMPPSDQTIFLGKGDIEQLWSRTNLYGELYARGVKVLPDHDHSIEVKYLNDPLKFYLEKCTLAIHFPEEFLPLSEKKLQDLAALSDLKRYIWFNPEVAKNTDKKKQYDELKQKLKNLNHIEAVTAGIEELKDIIFSGSHKRQSDQSGAVAQVASCIYLMVSDRFSNDMQNRLIAILKRQQLETLLLSALKTQQKRIQHYQYLQDSEYCLICYDGHNADWVSANINEVKKAAGLNPNKSKRIKLGIITEQAHVPGFDTGDSSYTLLSAADPGLEEALTRFVNEN